MAKIKDTDYLGISTQIRVMENRLLNRERMERMLEARTDDEAAKILAECGYGELTAVTHAALDELIARAREATYLELTTAIPNPSLVDVFRLKYDYHNVKVLLKARAVGAEADRLLVEGGRWPSAVLAEAVRQDDWRQISEPLRLAAAGAEELLHAGGDPQLADFVLDRAYFEEMRQLAAASGSDFLEGYVRLLIDVTNLRSAVRAGRMGKGADFLGQVLLPGGNVSERTLATAKDSELESIFRVGPLAEAAALGSTLAAPGSGGLTAFERMCDDALTAYLARAKRIPFGEQPVIGYLYARESELTAIRTIMTGRMAGLPADTIRERLREAYV